MAWRFPDRPAARVLAFSRLSARLAALLGASTVVTAAHALDARVRGPSDRRRSAFVRLWGSAVLRSLNVRLVIAPPKRPPPSEHATLVVANHRSTLDIPIVLSLFGGRLLSRDDVASWPLFGTMAKAAGTIFVERGSAKSGAMAVERIRDCLARSGTVCVFPEGTTFGGDEVRRFRSGAFTAAASENAVILPVGIAYADESAVFGDESFSAHARRIASAPATDAAVVVGAPLPTSGQSGRDLAERAREQVQALVFDARARIGPKSPPGSTTPETSGANSGPCP